MTAAWKALRDQRRAEGGKPFRIEVLTWLPEKYELHDLETGDVWAYVIEDGRARPTRKKAEVGR